MTNPSPKTTKPDGSKSASTKSKARQGKPAPSAAYIVPLGVADISSDESEVPRIKREPSASHSRANLKSCAPTEQGHTAVTDEKDLEFELRKIAIRRREVEIEQQEIEIDQQLHKLRRSGK